MADTRDLKSLAVTGVQVRVLPGALVGAVERYELNSGMSGRELTER